jgi:site-specific DNA recombinase
MKQLRFATLMRVSTNKQTQEGKQKKQAKTGKKSARPFKEDKDSLPLQKSSIMEFVNTQPEAHKGIEWIDSGLQFVETAVSAYHTHTSKRKGLQAAFEAAKNNEYDVLVIFKLDRFGRRAAESLDMAMKFLRYCRIWVVDKRCEFLGENEIQNFVEFWAAKKASEDTKDRVTVAMKDIHNDGYWTGGNPPYGYKNSDEFTNMLDVIPNEAETVKEIYNLYVNHGYGYLKISAHLNEKGIPSKIGGKWSAHTIGKILTNTIYMGHLSYGKTQIVEGEFGSYQKRLKSGAGTVAEKYWKEYDLIGKEMFEQAQKIKASRVRPNMFGGNTPSNKTTGKGLLIGILKCECGGNMTYSQSADWTDSTRTKKKAPYGIYRCQTRLKKGVAACGAKKATYRCTDLDAKIISRLNEYTTKLIQENHIEKVKVKTEAATENIKVKIDAVKQDIMRYTKAKENANEMLMKILMGESVPANKNQITEIYEAAEKQLEKLEKELKEFESLKSTDNLNEVDIMKLEDYIKNWEFIFNHGTQKQKRELIQAIATEIKVTKDKITIVTEMDVPKFVEAITSIKHSAAPEIAASLAALETQGVEASASFLQAVDSRSSHSMQNTGIEMQHLLQKLSKVFGKKVKNKMIIAS